LACGGGVFSAGAWAKAPAAPNKSRAQSFRIGDIIV
jgi:hypothetical protein